MDPLQVYMTDRMLEIRLRKQCLKLALSALGGEDRLPVDELIRVSETFYDYLINGPKKADPVKLESVKGH